MKLEGFRIVKLKAIVLLAFPPTAPSVSVEVPADAFEATARVSVLLPLPGAGILDFVKLALTPLGSPVTDKYTMELNPVPGVAVKVIGTEPPCATLAFVALAVKV